VVSQQKRAEDRLAQQQARETAQLREHGERMAALEKTKSEFLQLASHELRSPIGVVRGYLSMLEDGTLGPGDLPRVLPILSAKIQQVNLLMNELLETARLEARPVALALHPIDLRDVVRDSVRIMEPLVGVGPPIRVVVPDTEVPVLADGNRLESILTNLIDNAVKYSPGDREVDCSLTVSGDTAQVRVRDHGIGIGARDQQRLFQRFSRVVTDQNRHTSGTGLGLYIARELARQHGGDITVTSTVGEGSCFTVTLPLQRTPSG
jgi:signal transduction histidine kinase